MPMKPEESGELQRQQAFLLALSDALRPIADAVEIMSTASRLLGEYLGVGRVGYGEVEETANGTYLRIARDWTNGIMPSAAGFHRFADFGEEMNAAFLRGDDFVLEDALATFEGDPDVLKNYESTGALRSSLAVPLLKAGRVVAGLYAQSSAARQWSDGDAQLARMVADRIWSAAERARAETGLREAEERQSFLLRLSDALRLIADPAAIIATASHLLGEQLRVDRVAYGDMHEDGENITVPRDWGREGTSVPPLIGTYRVAQFGQFVADRFARQEVAAIHDARDNPDIPREDYEQTWGAIGVRAAIAVAVVKDGKPRAGFAVYSATPRQWTPAEQSLVDDVAQRIWDAVERARAGAALRQSEIQYRALFETMSQGYVENELIRDADGHAIDYRTMLVNPQFERLTGISAAQAVGHTARDLVGNLDPAWIETYDRVVRTGKPERFEREEPAFHRWFDVRAYPLTGDRFAILYDDITERRRIDAALRESEARHRNLLGSFAQAVWETSAEGVVVTDSPSWRAYTGQTLEEWLGYGWLNAIHPDDRAYAERQWREAMAARRLVDAEFRLRAPDGGWRWTNVRATPLIDAAGNIEKWAGMNIDIDDRKRAEAALRETQERQALLLRLTDSVRRAGDRDQILREASRLVGQHFGSSAHYAEVVEENGIDYYEVRFSHTEPGRPSFDGRYPVASFPGATDELYKGVTVAAEDVQTDPRMTESDRATYATANVRSFIMAPLLRNGRLVAVFAAHGPTTHVYSDADARLIDAVAERTWSEIHRLRAEEALRKSEERRELALEATNVGTFVWHVLEDRGEPDARMLALFDQPPDGTLTLSEAIATMIHPDDAQLYADAVAEASRPAGARELHEDIRVRHGQGWRWVAISARVSFDESGRPIRMAGTGLDITERKRAESELRESEERLREFSEASSDVLWTRRADDLQWEYLSPAFRRIYGIAREEALRGDNLHSWTNLIVPEDREFALANIEKARQGERVAFEYRVRRPEDGQIRWLRNTDFPIRDASGKVVRIGGIGHDLTELKRAEEHQRLLLAELQHRVRNTLAVIRSITRRTADTTESKDEFFMHLDGRIAAFARVQAAVTRDPTKGIDLSLLIAEELRIVGAQEGDSLSIAGPAIELTPRAAETLGLAIHELTTNAVKYGALSIEGGAIGVSWLITGEPRELDFEWIESGMSDLPATPLRRGFGTDVLERSLAYELKATTTLVFTPTGLHCRVALPLAQVIAAGA